MTNKPNGKLAFAYNTISNMEKRIAFFEGMIHTCSTGCTKAGCVNRGLQKRIAELEAQLSSGREPVAWMVFWGLGKKRPGALFIDREDAVRHAKQIKSETEVRPVYTHPAPSQRPLSDEQIFDFGPGQPDAVWSYEDQLYFARAIEAKHGIKGKP